MTNHRSLPLSQRNPRSRLSFLIGCLAVFSILVNFVIHQNLPTVIEFQPHRRINLTYQQLAPPLEKDITPITGPPQPKQTPPPLQPQPVGAEKELSETTSSFWKNNKAIQEIKKDRQGHILHQGITNLDDEALKKFGQSNKIVPKNITLEEARKGREELVQILQDAGVVVDLYPQSIARLPTWQEVTSLYGNSPVIYGLETCQKFRDSAPPDDASLGVAGLFNTGTNPLAMYLSANCIMPNNTYDAAHGMRWQVPWGKHMLASRKWKNTAANDEMVNKTNVLPVVLIRDPYSWMQSMCNHPYAAQWTHHKRKRCPNLVPTKQDLATFRGQVDPNATSFRVSVGYPGEASNFDSLAHFWDSWYNEYLHADFPRLIVRFEDIIFHQKLLVEKICKCAGAVPKGDSFVYVVGEGKWGSSHQGSSNLISAMIKYGNPDLRLAKLTPDDLAYAKRHIDPNLMQLFHYSQPYDGSIEGNSMS